MLDKLNEYGKKRKPIFFAIDFEMKNWIFEDENVQFQLENFRNFKPITNHKKINITNRLHVSFEEYKKALKKVKKEIKKGNTYLLNLTFETKLEGEIDLQSIFHSANAPFKLHVKDKFVCYSPERFVQIKDNQISTYPMKGTIEASIPHAMERILANQKEMSEHTMVVDLLRNDLGIVGKNIQVEKFRYIDKINAGKKELLQVSSKITADLDESWHENLGDIVKKMLPAGSITGTPKRKTVEIIKEIENYERGFFTGIFGHYDGKSFDSAVMIRFIEKTDEGYIFKSGGGITIESDALSEYEEMRDKVYV
ncbi:MAG TPA: aminodeoxychorismate synthase component I [Sulfurospirillum arcachonense]|nr:aminodeoxychorismate synthase component I [Sulfurospirillum arcachonense]